jgi:ribosomal protein S26
VGLFLSGDMQKTRRCPYCGKSVNLQKAIRVAQAETAMEASELLKQLKTLNKNANQASFRIV